jgi:hypothetical protein
MRMLTVSIIIGPLVLISALPAAGQSTLALGSGAPGPIGRRCRFDRRQGHVHLEGARRNAGMATKAA